jgi:hypothetical protein
MQWRSALKMFRCPARASACVDGVSAASAVSALEDVDCNQGSQRDTDLRHLARKAQRSLYSARAAIGSTKSTPNSVDSPQLQVWPTLPRTEASAGRIRSCNV